MKVLMVTPSFDPIKGGVEEVVKDFTIELNRIKVSTDVMTFNMVRKWNPIWKEGIQNVHNFNVFRIPAFNWFPMTHSDRLTFRINLIPGKFHHFFKSYDIVHFHDGGDLSFPFFSYFNKKRKILHIHGFTDVYKRNILFRYTWKKLADLYTPISKTIEKGLIEVGIPKSKIRLIPNGINTDIFQSSREKIANLLLFVGRLDSTKGLHILLEAIRHLKKPINLVIIGPSDWSSSYFRNILTTINTINEKTIHTITYLGKLEREETIRWYQKASIHVRSDIYGLGGGGLTVLEAFACETPVIATGNEIVKDGINGILVPPNDAIKLAEAIQFLLDNEYVGKRYGEEGRKCVLENFSIKVIVRRLCEVYEELMR